MQLRRLVLAALVLSTTLPVPAAMAAKARPLPCKQIADDEGDGHTAGMSSAALDILSADISTGAKEITATLRLKSTAVENDNALFGGADWSFNVLVGGTKYSFSAQWPSVVSIEPRKLSGGLTAGSNVSNPPAKFQVVGNDFLWTVSRAAMPPLKRAKQYIEITSASSGANSLGGSDSAFAKPGTKYLDKTPTCLRSK
jgi:hypothetical protein